MGLLSRGQAALNDRMEATAGGPVTYARGAASVALTAWVGRTLFSRTAQEGGPAVVWGDRDYLFRSAALILDGSATVPVKGDRITDNGLTFEVADPGTGEPHWRFSDQTRTVIRVHCKRVT